MRSDDLDGHANVFKPAIRFSEEDFLEEGSSHVPRELLPLSGRLSLKFLYQLDLKRMEFNVQA